MIDRKYHPYTIDVEGKRFGNLTVKKFLHISKSKKAVWECLCDCGGTVQQTKSQLNRNKSCGCLRNTTCSLLKWQGIGEISKDYWSSIRRGAEGRGITFDVLIEDGWNLFLSQNRKCALSGLDIELSRNRKKADQTASLDRIDSQKPYQLNNIQWVHKKVNLCKHVLSNDEFVNLCRLVVNNF